jgi:LPS sulfotransferase NodH
MDAGIVTGYEARFDFPHRDAAPELPYLLASVPRSGSTYVSHLLWRTGCLGAPLEYLNFEPLGPYGKAHGEPMLQSAIWREALYRRTSPNGVFGLKAFPLQLESLRHENPQLVAEVMRLMLAGGRGSKVIQLKRRDRDTHAISYARAMLSGVWRKEQETGGRNQPEYSGQAVENALRLIEDQESAWEAMYRDLGLMPLVLWFEDVLEDPQAAASLVADYLGAAIDPAAMVEVPKIERQSQKGAKAWVEARAKG